MKIKDNMMGAIFSYREANPTVDKLLAPGLCKCIAYRLPLPTEQVKSPTIWYITHADSEARSVINAVNEAYYVDIESLSNEVKTIWLNRYRMVHDSFALTEKELRLMMLGTSEECNAEDTRTLKSITNIFKSYIGD